MSDQPSTKPYLIRAIHEWCADNGFRPYIAVAVDETTEVPMEFVRGGEIVLNVSAEATHCLVIGNERIEFEARFNRIARQVSIPVANVTAIYAAENGHGMAFDVAKPLGEPRSAPTLHDASAAQPSGASPAGAAAESLSEPPKAPRRRSRVRKTEAPAAAPMALVALPSAAPSAESPTPPSDAETPRDPVPPPSGGRPRLTRVK